MKLRIPIAATVAAVMTVGSFGLNAAHAAPVAPLPTSSLWGAARPPPA